MFIPVRENHLPPRDGKSPMQSTYQRGGWLIPQAMAAYQSLSVGHCCWHDEDSAVVVARSALAEPMLNLHPCMISVLLLSALNKCWENWGKKQIGFLKTEILSTWLPIISSTVWPFVTVTWDPIRVDSKSFIYITHPKISLPPISNLFTLISLKI